MSSSSSVKESASSPPQAEVNAESTKASMTPTETSPPVKETPVTPPTTTTTSATPAASATEKATTTGEPNGTDVTPPAPTPAPHDDLVPEEEITEGDWGVKQVDVKEVAVVTGEEDEDVFWKHRAKLYRWAKNKDEGEWKERGLGDAKLMIHKETGKIRFLLRQEKTLKVMANHYVVKYGSSCNLTPNVSSDKIWVWSAPDSSEDELRTEQFALKFKDAEAANLFKQKFLEATDLNAKAFKVPEA